MLSTRDFFTFQSKGLLQHTVSALARLTSYENLSIAARNKCPLSALTGIRIKQVEFMGFLWGQRKLSVIGGVCIAGFDCIIFFSFIV